MVKFYCQNCGYSFAPREKSTLVPPKVCPYCNRKDSVNIEKTAEQLLNEFTGSD